MYIINFAIRFMVLLEGSGVEVKVVHYFQVALDYDFQAVFFERFLKFFSNTVTFRSTDEKKKS